MDHTGVIARLMMRQFLFFFNQQQAPIRKTQLQLIERGCANNTATDNNNVVASFKGRWCTHHHKSTTHLARGHAFIQTAYTHQTTEV